VVVNRHGEFLLGDLLSDDIKVEEFFYFQWFGKLIAYRGGYDIVSDDFIADVDTLVADIDGRPCDELIDVVLALGTERTSQNIVALFVFSQGDPPA
jgi:hypothetical protein